MYSNGYSLKIDGDFGGFRIDNAYYWSTDISFKSPSEHTIRGARLPMEMQINFHTRDNLQAVVSVLFRESERDSVFLNSLGFGNPQLRNAQ